MLDTLDRQRVVFHLLFKFTSSSILCRELGLLYCSIHACLFKN